MITNQLHNLDIYTKGMNYEATGGEFRSAEY